MLVHQCDAVMWCCLLFSFFYLEDSASAAGTLIAAKECAGGARCWKGRMQPLSRPQSGFKFFFVSNKDTMAQVPHNSPKIQTQSLAVFWLFSLSLRYGMLSCMKPIMHFL